MCYRAGPESVVVGSSLRVESVHAVWGADVRAGVLVGPDGREIPVLVRLSPIDATPDALARAQEDLVELRRVVGPAILPVEQVAAVGGQLARVYAWFDGGSLRVVLDASRAAGSSLPARVAVEVAAQVARALDSGRRSVGGHVVHAGCGPEDVLLDRAGQVCVTGFVVLRPGELLSMRPGYRAPAEADPWTYMLGALLFEMLVGDTPPTRGTPWSGMP